MTVRERPLGLTDLMSRSNWAESSVQLNPETLKAKESIMSTKSETLKIETNTNKTDEQLLANLTSAGKAAASGAQRLTAAILEAAQHGIDRAEIRDHLIETTPLSPSTVGQYLSTAFCKAGKRQKAEGGGAKRNELAPVILNWLMNEHGLTFKQAKSAALAASRMKEEELASDSETEEAAANAEAIAA